MKFQGGFALPTVLIISIIMMTLLLAGLSATTSTSASIRTQYEDKLIQEAAESGMNFMIACIKLGTIPTSGTFKPNSTSCTDPTLVTNGSKSEYVLDSTNYKTSFSINFPVKETSAGVEYYSFSSTGTLKTFSTSNQSTSVRDNSRQFSKKILYEDNQVSRAASGALFSCSIVSKQSYCWGLNESGQLGSGGQSPTGTFEADSNGNPKRVQVVRKVSGQSYYNVNSDLDGTYVKEIDISAGGGFACVITTVATDNDITIPHNQRKVACWGMEEGGRLGNGQSVTSTAIKPYPKFTLAPWASSGRYPMAVDVDNGSACVMTNTVTGDTNGNLWCWGNNGRGQLGRGPAAMVDSSTPLKVVGMAGETSGIFVTQIASATTASHKCAIRPNSQAICWGWNIFGQVGDGTDGYSGGAGDPNRFKTRPETVIVATTLDVLRAHAIAVGGASGAGDAADDSAQSCAIAKNTGSYGVSYTDKHVYCWGTNNYGQIGKGVTETIASKIYARANYVQIAGTTNYDATHIAIAHRTVCAAVVINGTSKQVYCWGNNDVGEIGRGVTTGGNFPTPVVVPFFANKNISQLTGGGSRFCAVVERSNYCWGRDGVGQVGDGKAGDENGNPFEADPSKSLFDEPTYQGVTY